MPKPSFPDNTQKPDSTTLPRATAMRRSDIDRYTSDLTRNPGDPCRGQGPSGARCAEPLTPAWSAQTLIETLRTEGDAILPSGERPHLRSERGSEALTSRLPLGLSILQQVTSLIQEWRNRARLRRLVEIPGFERLLSAKKRKFNNSKLTMESDTYLVLVTQASML